MDARRVLGVDVAADDAAIEHAYRRHLARIAPSRQGVPAALGGLGRFLTAARDASLRSDSVAAPDPVDLFALADTMATPDIVRVQWRRLAALSHPDQGGTDELFRAVSHAHDVLTGNVRRRRLRPRYEPPPPPPPPGPFVAPSPEARVRGTLRQAWRALAYDGSMALVTVAGPTLTAYALGTVSPPSGVLILFTAPLIFVRFGQQALFDASRAFTRLQLMRRPVPADRSPARFLEERALDVPVGREWDDLVYDAYTLWCRHRRIVPLVPRVFMEELRSYGLLHIRAAGWDRGLWIGLKLARTRAGD